MFEKIKYRKLKEMYEEIISSIKADDIDDMKESLISAFTLATQLYNKLKSNSKQNSSFAMENFLEVERIYYNLSWINSLYCGYLSYTNYMSYEHILASGDLEKTIETCQNARFYLDDIYKFKKINCNEPELLVKQNNGNYYCDGFKKLIYSHGYVLDKYLTINSDSVDRECYVNKLLKEQKRQEEERETILRAQQEAEEQEAYKRLQEEKQKEHMKYLEKCKNNIELGFKEGNTNSWLGGSHLKDAIEWYEYAYNWACEDEQFDDDKENARELVAETYLKYINQVYTSLNGEPSYQKMEICDEALDLCKEAEPWIHEKEKDEFKRLISWISNDRITFFNEYMYDD